MGSKLVLVLWGNSPCCSWGKLDFEKGSNTLQAAPPSQTQLVSKPSHVRSHGVASAPSQSPEHGPSAAWWVTTRHWSVHAAVWGSVQSGDEQGMSQSSTGQWEHAAQSSCACGETVAPPAVPAGVGAVLGGDQKDGFIGSSVQGAPWRRGDAGPAGAAGDSDKHFIFSSEDRPGRGT